MIRRLMVGAVLAGLLGAAATASAAENWSGPLYEITTDGVSATPIAGSKVTLKRHEDAVSYGVKATGLTPGNAYTVWLMAWNHPEFCIDPDTARGFQCGPGDFGNAAAFFSVMWGAGDIVQDSTHVFTGERRRFDMSRVLIGPGIGNPADVEVKFLVRDHGKAARYSNMRYSQTTTIDGGCSSDTAVMPPTGLHGRPGNRECKDIQATGSV